MFARWRSEIKQIGRAPQPVREARSLELVSIPFLSGTTRHETFATVDPDPFLSQSPSYRGPHSRRAGAGLLPRPLDVSIPFLSGTTPHDTEGYDDTAGDESQSPSYRGPHSSVRYLDDADGAYKSQFPSYRGPHGTKLGEHLAGRWELPSQSPSCRGPHSTLGREAAKLGRAAVSLPLLSGTTQHGSLYRYRNPGVVASQSPSRRRPHNTHALLQQEVGPYVVSIPFLPGTTQHWASRVRSSQRQPRLNPLPTVPTGDHTARC